jgi:hypothetical protein
MARTVLAGQLGGLVTPRGHRACLRLQRSCASRIQAERGMTVNAHSHPQHRERWQCHSKQAVSAVLMLWPKAQPPTGCDEDHKMPARGFPRVPYSDSL